MTEGHHESARAIIAAFLANLGIAVMKFVAFVFTGSSSMLSEAIHSVADTGNQGLLLLGRRHARRPPDEQHPFGYGTLRYFYAFIVAVVLFSAGGLFSIFEGINKLRNPHAIESAGWAIAVLLGAFVMEALSFRTGMREAGVVRPAGETWWQFIRHTKGPDLPVVLLEDTAALIGLCLALVGVTLAEVTGNSRWDAIGSLAIGALLVAVAVVLVVEMGSLLVGEAARPEDVARIRATIEAFPAVRRCIHLRTEHLGPDEIIVATKVEFLHELTVPQLATTIDDLEVEIRAAEPRATLIFVEPDVYREPEREPDRGEQDTPG
ncbi:MAG TPA: cation diffusion facilitator family transporter [Acidimicrobiia bacterium]|nr:cation diffusion facilitator family transporter [Acidimicrobiia bacterium]